MTDPTDGQLLRAWHEGDVEAFAGLVDRFQGALLAYARFLPGGAADAEDVVQEVFLRLARQPPALPGEARGIPRLETAHLASWLYRVTRNCAMELVRSNTRRRLREERVALEEAAGGGQAAVDANDTRRAVEDGLLGLREDQREVLVLRLLAERSYREIAEITGRKIGTVAWLISDGLKALSARLAPALAPEVELRGRVAELKGESS